MIFTNGYQALVNTEMAKEPRVNVKCATCGNDTTTTERCFLKNKTGNFFCNIKCRNLFGSLGKKIVNCLNCGIEMEVLVSRINSGHGKFCSKRCRSKWETENKSGINSPIYRKIKCICSYCGKEKMIYRCLAGKSKNNFCNNECHAKWRSEHIIGENNPNWNPNISDLERKSRRERKINVEYKNWRIKIFERDNFTCVYCGSRESGTLNAHHIIPFSKDKSLRFELSNGITLCKKCHKKEHDRLRKLSNENYDLFTV
jgi:5-methylcytosine-specific restriction endonuclease McrA